MERTGKHVASVEQYCGEQNDHSPIHTADATQLSSWVASRRRRRFVLAQSSAYFLLVTRTFCVVVDNGIHWPLCGGVRTRLAVDRRHQIPQVGWLVGATAAGPWRHTLGLSAVPGDAAATCRTLCEADRQRRHYLFLRFPMMFSKPLVDSHLPVT